MALMNDMLIDKQELMKWVSCRNPDFPPAVLAYLLDLPEQAANSWEDSPRYDWD